MQSAVARSQDSGIRQSWVQILTLLPTDLAALSRCFLTFKMRMLIVSTPHSLMFTGSTAPCPAPSRDAVKWTRLC